MSVPSYSQFVQLLRKSRLVDSQRLSELLENEFETGDKQNVEQLAKRLIKLDWITPWHAKKLLAGKFKGFFLGKYRLLDHVGAGGMSNVYLAQHSRMNRLVAIKVLPPSRVSEPGYVERFRLEAKAAAQLHHPNIVRAYDVDAEGELHYLVMEYVRGINLHQLVKQNGPLEVKKAVDYARQAALGLEHAHQAGLVHRDVKPSNLLVTEQDAVKLLDLGLAFFPEKTQGPDGLAEGTRILLGTADYLAPEQAVDCYDVDSRADIYSLGCTLFYLLSGHPPFAGGTFAQRIQKHQTDEPPDVALYRPDCPPSVVQYCVRMLQKEPADRYQTMAEVADELEAWLASQNNEPKRAAKETPSSIEGAVIVPASISEIRIKTPDSKARPSHRPARVRRSWSVWLVILILTILCIVLMIVVFMANP
ncbi:MAG: serine/threonine protein kinase [Planctomycetales bacterium]|nr:serine/threonine protein kinase [Planctomycetales bacterium]